MKVNFSPVGFKGNSGSNVESAKGNACQCKTLSQYQNDKELPMADIVCKFNNSLRDWIKVYDETNDSVCVMPPYTDEFERFVITSDGSAYSSYRDKYIVKENKDLAKYVQQMKAVNRDNINSPIELFNSRLQNNNWIKSYLPAADIVQVKEQNCVDGTEYSIYSNGQVIQTSGWSQPRVILEEHEELGKYHSAMKNAVLKSGVNVSFGNNEEAKDANSNLIEAFKQKPVYETTAETTTEKPAEKTVEKPVETVVAPALEDAQTGNAEPNKTKQKTTFKEKVANVWKFFASLGQMATAVFKGIGYGAVTAGGMLAGSWLFNTLPNAFTKEGPKFAQIIKHPIKHIGKSGKIFAGIGAACVFAYHLIVGKLAANQKTAVIDHKMKVGHRDV